MSFESGFLKTAADRHDAFSRKTRHPGKRHLNLAIRKGRDVTITYRKPDGSESTRQVSPLTAKNDLLVAKDHSRDGQLRSFKLERILSVKPHRGEAMQKAAMDSAFARGFLKVAAEEVKETPPADDVDEIMRESFRRVLLRKVTKPVTKAVGLPDYFSRPVGRVMGTATGGHHHDNGEAQD